MKPNSLLLPLVYTGPVTASFFHWGHHDEHVVRHYKYSGPFGDNLGAPEGYESVCEGEASFKAKEYSKEDLKTNPPYGLSSWAPAIEHFLAGRVYPGHWKGVDDHGDENSHRREYLVMEYSDVPRAVRAWIEDHQRKGTDTHYNWMFAVLQKPKGDQKILSTLPPPQATPATGAEGGTASVAETTNQVHDSDKILFFAAGSIYEILPLWVAEGSKCEAAFLDLNRYHPQPIDRGVIAWPTEHTNPESKSGPKTVKFTIKAMTVEFPLHERKRQEAYNRMMRNVAREARKSERASRGKRDEL